MSLRMQSSETALGSMLLLVIIIAVFVAGTLLLARDIRKIVLEPLERLTEIVRKLAGMIFELAKDDVGAPTITDEEYEEQVIATLLEKVRRQLAARGLADARGCMLVPLCTRRPGLAAEREHRSPRRCPTSSARRCPRFAVALASAHGPSSVTPRCCFCAAADAEPCDAGRPFEARRVLGGRRDDGGEADR